MITNLDNIDKVINILSKSLSKKYPYLGDIQVKDINDDVGIIQINIDIDLNGTNISADDIMRRFKAELALINAKEGRVRTVGGSY